MQQFLQANSNPQTKLPTSSLRAALQEAKGQSVKKTPYTSVLSQPSLTDKKFSDISHAISQTKEKLFPHKYSTPGRLGSSVNKFTNSSESRDLREESFSSKLNKTSERQSNILNVYAALDSTPINSSSKRAFEVLKAKNEKVVQKPQTRVFSNYPPKDILDARRDSQINVVKLREVLYPEAGRNIIYRPPSTQASIRAETGSNIEQRMATPGKEVRSRHNISISNDISGNQRSASRERILEKLKSTKDKLNISSNSSNFTSELAAKSSSLLKPGSLLSHLNKLHSSPLNDRRMGAKLDDDTTSLSEFKPSFHSKLEKLFSVRNYNQPPIDTKAQDSSNLLTAVAHHQPQTPSLLSSAASPSRLATLLGANSSPGNLHPQHQHQISVGQTFFSRILHKDYLKPNATLPYTPFGLFIDDCKEQAAIMKIMSEYYESKTSSSLPGVTLPPSSKSRVLFLDLDETLVRTEKEELYKRYDATVNIIGKSHEEKIGVWFRPFLKQFLERVNKHFQVVLFTAANKEYADRVVETFDPQNSFFSTRLYRVNCEQIGGKVYR